MFTSHKSLRSMLRQSLAACIPCGPGRRFCRRVRKCGVEALEVRQLLTGDLLWARDFGGTGLDTTDDVTVDSSGNVLMAGTFTGVVDFDPGPSVVNLTSAGTWDIFVTKLDSSGNLVWARRMGGTDSEGVFKLVVDAAGNVYTTGYFRGRADFNPSPATTTELVSSGLTDGFISKLDAAGNFVWASRFGSTGDDSGKGLVVDSAGVVFVTGSFSGTVDFNPNLGIAFNLTSAGATDIFVSRMDASGGFLNGVRIGGTGDDIPTSLVLDTAGSPHLAGRFSGTVDFDPGTTVSNLTSAGFTDIFVGRLDSSLNLLWARRMGGTSAEGGASLAVDSSGSIYAAGGFETTVDFDPGSGEENLSSAGSNDIFVSKLTSAGSFVWARCMGSSGNDVCSNVVVDQQGGVFLSGWFAGTVDFDPGSAVATLTSAGGRDIVVAKLDSAGNAVFARRMGGTAEDDGTALALEASGDVYVVGQFAGTADFDPGSGIENLIGDGSSDAFLVRLSPEMRFTLSVGLSGDVKLKRDGDWVELAFNGTGTSGQYVLLERHRLAAIRSIRTNGSSNSNSLTIDYATGGGFSIAGGIHHVGGNGLSDSVRLIGTGVEGIVYAPSSTVGGSGKFIAHGTQILFTGVESTFVRSTQLLAVETQGSTDVLTVTAATGFTGNLASRIAGTTDGQAMPSITFDNVRDLTVETGLMDGILPESHDAVTFGPGSYAAQGLKNVFIRTGQGNDALTVNGPDIGLPAAESKFWFLGGSGVDVLTAIGDANWDLNDIRLVSSGGGRILHDEIEKASLTGGAGKNHLNASLFSGDVTLDGSGDNDLLRGGSGNDLIFGGIGNDRISGGFGDDTIYGQDGLDQLWGEAGEDTLYGNAGNDQLWGGDDNDWLSGDAGDDWLYGGNGNDTLLGGTNNDVLAGEAGADILNGGGGIDLYDLAGTVNAEDLQLQRLSATSALFKRKPRGLSTVLEQDAISMDAADEFLVSALGGDDLITIDSLFTQLGSVDGGDGIDTCTAPAAWTKVSC